MAARPGTSSTDLVGIIAASSTTTDDVELHRLREKVLTREPQLFMNCTDRRACSKTAPSSSLSAWRACTSSRIALRHRAAPAADAMPALADDPETLHQRAGSSRYGRLVRRHALDAGGCWAEHGGVEPLADRLRSSFAQLQALGHASALTWSRARSMIG